ncbi:MAG: adenylosuccinate synthetase [Ruminococcaceae bacterium]|nr:adenylosuccinate synthetase [Oscillospiraceae bacterium]
MIFSVVGCNYGDEGKGLVTDYLCSRSPSALVVRHNGGAQSGHTVEDFDKRFVFHELSSGSFRNADTYWAETFLPDLYKLGDEYSDFFNLSGIKVKIFASPLACITTIDDILINMLLEESRGDKRHGSCGMGINEADTRNKAGFSINLGTLKTMSADSLFLALKHIRTHYSERHICELSLQNKTSEYLTLLRDDDVLRNFSDVVFDNLKYITVAADEKELFGKYSDIIFETGQGLQLDSLNEENIPHVTASRTGLTNPAKILNKLNLKLDGVFYVTRSYLTRHGAGPIENQNDSLKDTYKFSDLTNIPNPWQGEIRYAYFDAVEKFLKLPKRDVSALNYGIQKNLVITHLNETKDCMLFKDNKIPVSDFANNPNIKAFFDKIYLSSTPFSNDFVSFE